MQYKIFYSKRKTISLMVNRQAEVIIRAPRRVSLQFIEELVVQRKDWIEKALEQQQKNHVVRMYTEGEEFLFLGNNYPLKVLENFRSRIEFNNAFYISRYKLSNAKQLFERWYKEKALEVLRERVGVYSKSMGLPYKKISVKNTIAQWGSCSKEGNLSFSYRLILAPLEILDYVVVHELAHIVQKNHSAKFWQLVSNFYPQHLQARTWLKKNGSSLQTHF